MSTDKTKIMDFKGKHLMRSKIEIQGDSVARVLKLLSIKNYVIEIVT